MGLNESKKLNMRPQIVIASLIALIAVIAVYFYMSSNDGKNMPTGNDTPTAEIEQPEPAKEEVPAFDLVRISRGGTGVIAGRMTPGSRVELFANGKKVSEVTADENGEWVMILEEPLEAGSVELNLKASGRNGTAIAEARNVVVVSVPERDNDRFLERQQNGVVAVLSPKDGEGQSTVLQKPGVAAYSEVGESLSIDTVDYGDGGSVVFAGRSLPRVAVRLYLDDSYVGMNKADDAGRWSIAMQEGSILASGDHIIRLDQTIGDGKVQLRVIQPFETGAPIDLSAARGGVIVKPGNTLWQIARQLYGTGVRYTLIFKENSEQIKDPDLIYPGQLFEIPKKTDE